MRESGSGDQFLHIGVPQCGVGDILRYGKGEEPDKEGTIKHAAFTLEGQEFAAMDSAHEHNFTFNEAISFMVECETQEEIDYYWEKLTADGGQESMCGWLKDRFGVSWQVTPTVLGEMLQDPDQKKVERVTNAFLKMKKFDIEGTEEGYKGNGQQQIIRRKEKDTMTKLNTYLNFAGNTEEAFKFYRSVFGGDSAPWSGSRTCRCRA